MPELDFRAADETVITQATTLHEKALKAVVTQLEKCSLSTIEAATELGRVEELRAFLAKHTSDGQSLRAAHFLNGDLALTLRVGCWLLLEKLGKLEETQEELLIGTSETQERKYVVQDLHDRLGGQGTLSLEPAA